MIRSHYEFITSISLLLFNAVANRRANCKHAFVKKENHNKSNTICSVSRSQSINVSTLNYHFRKEKRKKDALRKNKEFLVVQRDLEDKGRFCTVGYQHFFLILRHFCT